MSRPRSLQQCKSGKHFVVYSERQGAEIREGGRHTIIKTDKGSVAVPRHGNRDLATGTWHAVYKGLIAIGIVGFMIVMALDALSLANS
jgi:predicted RNA binding protein YcfA (HicA-like mRNA interferase family)